MKWYCTAVHQISFKPSWAPLWHGWDTITCIALLSVYPVVKRKPNKKNTKPLSHAWQTRQAWAPTPSHFFLLFSTLYISVSVSLSLSSSPLNSLLPSFATLPSCHLPSPPTQQSAVHSSAKITLRPGQSDTSFISSCSSYSLHCHTFATGFPQYGLDHLTQIRIWNLYYKNDYNSLHNTFHLLVDRNKTG